MGSSCGRRRPRGRDSAHGAGGLLGWRRDGQAGGAGHGRGRRGRDPRLGLRLMRDVAELGLGHRVGDHGVGVQRAGDHRWGDVRPHRSAFGDAPATKGGLGRQSDLAIGGIGGRPALDGAPVTERTVFYDVSESSCRIAAHARRPRLDPPGRACGLAHVRPGRRHGRTHRPNPTR
ncbi:hypothetical protein FAIPA1_150070 [Frankia sp. AiPs1]